MSKRFNVILVVLAVMMAMLAVTPGASGAIERAEPKCFGSTATIMGTSSNETLNGTDGDDVIIGMGGDDVINGMGGDDKLCGKNGVDTINGGDGDDDIDGGKGNDTLNGDAGDDTIKGGKGNDTLNGGTGDDDLFGGRGGDTLSGGDGDDTEIGNAGTDSCDIADGASTLSSCESTFGTPPSGTTTTTTTTTTPSGDHLDITLTANQNVTLPTNFPTDPRTFNVSSGGSIATEYLNTDPQLAPGQGNCKGFAIKQPDLQLTYEPGSSTRPLLRFFWIPNTPGTANGTGDAVLIINAPNGKWFCNDDANNTLNPQIDFNNPSTGVYDVYVASRVSGGGAGGTLSITELSSHNSATG